MSDLQIHTQCRHYRCCYSCSRSLDKPHRVVAEGTELWNRVVRHILEVAVHILEGAEVAVPSSAAFERPRGVVD